MHRFPKTALALLVAALAACATSMPASAPERRFDLALYTTANSAAIREQQASIHACYDNVERHEGRGPWTFELRWHVDADGHAQSVEIVDAPFDEPAIAECITHAALAVSFAPRRKAGTVVVRQRLPMTDTAVASTLPSGLR
jgi:hypothetical protein